MEQTTKQFSLLTVDNHKPLKEKISHSVSFRTLLILDLNGILVDRMYHPASIDAAPKGAVRVGNFFVWKRPGYEKFLEMVFRHFDVAVWSSVSKRNINALVDEVFGEKKKDLVFVWDQTKCHAVENPDAPEQSGEISPKQSGEISPEKEESGGMLYLKNLVDVWRNYQQYNSNNTLIIDDTPQKMRNNPSHCVMIDCSWHHHRGGSPLDIGHGIMRRIAYSILFG